MNPKGFSAKSIKDLVQSILPVLSTLDTLASRRFSVSINIPLAEGELKIHITNHITNASCIPDNSSDSIPDDHISSPETEDVSQLQPKPEPVDSELLYWSAR